MNILISCNLAKGRFSYEKRKMASLLFIKQFQLLQNQDKVNNPKKEI